MDVYDITKLEPSPVATIFLLLTPWKQKGQFHSLDSRLAQCVGSSRNHVARFYACCLNVLLGSAISSVECVCSIVFRRRT